VKRLGWHGRSIRPAQHYVIIELPIGWGGTEPHPTPDRHVLLGWHLQRDGKLGGNAVIRGWRLPADRGYVGKARVTEVTSGESVKPVMIRLA
jgi:hypothetical protein